MAKNIREIIKKLPKKRQAAIEMRAKVLINEEMNLLAFRAQEELAKLVVTVDQLKSGIRKRSQKKLKTRYPGLKTLR